MKDLPPKCTKGQRAGGEWGALWGRLGGSALPSISSCPSGLSWRGTKGRGSWREGQGFRAQLSQHTSTLPFPVPPPVPAPSTLLPPPDSLPHHCSVLPAFFFTPLVPSLPSLDCGFSPAFLKKTPVPQCQGQLPRAFKPQNCSARPIRVSSPSHVRGSRGTERSRNLPEVTQFTGGRSPPKAETRNQSPQVAQHLDLNSGLLTLRSDFFPLHPTHSAHRLRPFC